MAELHKKKKEKEKFVLSYAEDVSKTDQGKPVSTLQPRPWWMCLMFDDLPHSCDLEYKRTYVVHVQHDHILFVCDY